MAQSYPLLPIVPIWSALAVNTIVYALASWLLIAAIVAIIRRVRRSHHLCAACGYPRGRGKACVECGSM